MDAPVRSYKVLLRLNMFDTVSVSGVDINVSFVAWTPRLDNGRSFAHDSLRYYDLEMLPITLFKSKIWIARPWRYTVEKAQDHYLHA